MRADAGSARTQHPGLGLQVLGALVMGAECKSCPGLPPRLPSFVPGVVLLDLSSQLLYWLRCNYRSVTGHPWVGWRAPFECSPRGSSAWGAR